MSIPVGCLRHGAKVNYIKNFARPPGSTFQQPRQIVTAASILSMLSISIANIKCHFFYPRARTANYAISLLSVDAFQFFWHFTVRSIWFFIYRFPLTRAAAIRTFPLLSRAESARARARARGFRFCGILLSRRKDLFRDKIIASTRSYYWRLATAAVSLSSISVSRDIIAINIHSYTRVSYFQYYTRDIHLSLDPMIQNIVGRGIFYDFAYGSRLTGQHLV